MVGSLDESGGARGDGRQAGPQPVPAPRRAAIIFVLGILLLWFAFRAAIPLGIIPWVMGSRDLRAMKAGLMGRRGRRLTVAGQVLGIISLPICVVQWVFLLVVFLRAQERARLACCISNQKELVVAATRYAQDHDGLLPDIGTYSNGFHGSWRPGADWRDLIRDYVRASDIVYRCPTVSRRPSPSYAWNRHLSGYPLAGVEYPATTPLIWDWVPGHETAPGIPLDLEGLTFWPSGTDLPSRKDMRQAVTRHGGGGRGLVLAFVDGHASFERPARCTPQGTGSRFMPCEDRATRRPPQAARGIAISMYPQDPMRAGK